MPLSRRMTPNEIIPIFVQCKSTFDASCLSCWSTITFQWGFVGFTCQFVLIACPLSISSRLARLKYSSSRVQTWAVWLASKRSSEQFPWLTSFKQNHIQPTHRLGFQSVTRAKILTTHCHPPPKILSKSVQWKIQKLKDIYFRRNLQYNQYNSSNNNCLCRTSGTNSHKDSEHQEYWGSVGDLSCILHLREAQKK